MKLFTLDIIKDSKMIGEIFTLKGIGENSSNLRGKLIDIDKEGYYRFHITSHNSEYEEYLTRAPNAGEIEKWSNY